MNRKQFIMQSCTACMAIAVGASMSEWLESCTAPAYIYSTHVSNKSITLAKSIFAKDKFKVVQTKELEHGIFVIKGDDGGVKAFSMKCTHKYAELTLNGNQLHCPKHGSIFDFTGQVTKGPAKTALEEYPVQIDGDSFIIKV